MKKQKLQNENQFSLDFGDNTAVLELPPLPITKVASAVKALAKKEDVFVLTNQLDALDSQDKKIKANIQALELLKELKQTRSELTPEHKAILSRYTGWGGAAKVFKTEESQYTTVKSLLNDVEFNDARSSVLTSYFTEPFIIKSIWNILRKMGFTGGKVLETSAGVGHFIGAMPEDMRANSQVVMVEPDSVSGTILNHLYDERAVRVYPCGLESAPLKSESFDLAISNVPFGQYRVHDKRFNSMKLVIHDYFFAKALDMVRPGGVVAFITSTGTLDKSSLNLRTYLAGKADLVTAIRLPGGAFNRLGGTAVETDIVVLRKKALTDTGHTGLCFLHSGDGKHMADYGASYFPNQVFCSKPFLHIGKAVKASSRYSDSAIKIEFKDNLEEKLASVVDRMEGEAMLAGWYKPAVQVTLENEVGAQTPEGFVSGYFFDENQRVAFLSPNGNVETQSHLSARAYQRLSGMVTIRDSVLSLIESDAMEMDSTVLRSNLNQEYDQFVKVNGFISDATNRRLISMDSHAPLLWSLEYYDEENEACKKAEIFTRSTVSTAVLAETASSIGDAIALSYNRFGKLDLEFLAKSLSRSTDDVIGELLREGLAYLDPQGDGVVDAQDYLANNVRVKLMQAKSAAVKDGRFDVNVRALQAVVPPTVPIGDISIRLGASWLDPEDIEQFVQDCVFNEADERGDGACKVIHSDVMAVWSVKGGYWAIRNAKCSSEWGTSRVPFFALLQTGLNQQQPEVRDDIELDGKTKSVINAVETTAAREKLEKIQEAFAAWVKADAVRAGRLEEIFNDLFNSKVNREYDGKHLVIPGLNPVIKLRAAQLDSIWRGIVSGNVLYALAVGGGKTLIQIILAQESKRLGLAQKPTLVVPNHMLEAFAAEYMRAFPRAKILAASKADMEGDKRRTLMMRIATGNWDAVIMTHSSYGKIAVSKEFVEAYAKKELDKIETAFKEVSASTDDYASIRDIERTKKVVENRLKSLAERSDKDNGILPFDKMGIDLVIVDEADLFKNLWFFTKKTRVAGLTRSASLRAFDMYLKSRVVFAKRGSNQHGLVFATATPISNTVAEMFIMQTYLQCDALKEAKVEEFDAWAANFGREVTSIEVAPDGSGFRMHTRFCRFENVPELTRMFREVAEIRTQKMLDLPVPRLSGGGHKIVAVSASEELKAYVQTLVGRAEQIRSGQVKPNEDNMLVVTGDGRKAALDMRCINDAYADHKGSKVNACVENVFRHWEDGRDQKLTQLVFCDMSTPSSERFSVYIDMKAKFLARGIPDAEIAFAQDFDTDHKKAELHRKVRAGRIRLVLGSTQLMGFGTNVQDKLVAEHHLDAPWRPRDVQQRDGRIERQGNLNEEIFIYRYVTEGSFDAYMWQTLETKAKFIEQIYEGTGDARTIEDVSSQSLSCAEVKALASGNPMVIEKAGIDNEVAKLWNIKQSWMNSQGSMKREKAFRLDNQDSLIKAIADCETDISQMEVAEKTVTVGPMTMAPCEDVVKEMMQIVETAKLLSAGNEKRQKSVCKVAAMELRIETQFGGHCLAFVGSSGRLYEVRIPYGMENRIKWLSTDVWDVPVDSLTTFKGRLSENQKMVASLSEQIGRPFEYEVRLKNAIARQVEIDTALGLISSEAGANALEETVD